MLDLGLALKSSSIYEFSLGSICLDLALVLKFSSIYEFRLVLYS